MRTRFCVVWLVVLHLFNLIPLKVFAEEDSINIKITDTINTQENKNEEDVNIEVTYLEVIETIVKTINKKDSYFYEIINPDDFEEYVKSLDVELPNDLTMYVNRAEFARLIIEIYEKMTKNKAYTTNLIEITDIFSDLDNLSDAQINAIKSAYIMGLMSGVSNSTYNPNGNITKWQLNKVMERLMGDFTRKNLFSKIESGFSEENRLLALNGEKDRSLNYQDMIGFLFVFADKPYFNEYETKELTIKDFLDLYFEQTDCNILIYDSATEEYFYPAKDTIVLSDEEWEYLNTNQEKIMLLSEGRIFTERIKKLKETIQEFNHFGSWEEVDEFAKSYLGFIYPVIPENKNCIEYFMEYEVEKPWFVNYSQFSRAVHEAQHESSARLSHTFCGRRILDSGEWQIRWSNRPATHYYFDFTNSSWVDSKNIYTPNTSTIYYSECTKEIKENEFLKRYATDYDLISNIYGLQGLLQEYCSYGLQAKIELIVASLPLFEGYVGNSDYDWFLLLKYMVMESLNYLEEHHINSYNAFMEDTDMVRFLNNTLREMDYFERIYKRAFSVYGFWFTDELLLWGYDLDSPVSFKPIPIKETVNQ